MTEHDRDQADLSFAEVLVKRLERDQQRNPSLRFTDSAILKEGPQAYKVATHHEIINPNTGEFHHNAVKIQTFRHKPSSIDENGSLLLDAGHSISIDDDHGDEIGALHAFLRAIIDRSIPESTGDYLVIPVHDGMITDQIGRLLGTVSGSERASLLIDLIDKLRCDREAIAKLIGQINHIPEAVRHFAAALNVARYTEAIDQLTALIEANAPELQFQNHLTQNPWMFGSEYSKLLDRRTWVRDSQKDFMLRRTVDGYLEIIEIKTTLDGADYFYMIAHMAPTTRKPTSLK